MSRMESSKAGQLANLEVVFTEIAGIILFNEKHGISFYWGASNRLGSCRTYFYT